MTREIERVVSIATTVIVVSTPTMRVAAAHADENALDTPNAGRQRLCRGRGTHAASRD
jgi:hypothetical protein